MKNYTYIAWFDAVDKDDIALVGGKGANLGEMFQAGFPVPYGFVVKANAYFDFIREKKLQEKMKQQLKVLNHHDPQQLRQTANIIQKMILKESLPEKIAREIMIAYLDLPFLSSQKRKFSQKLVSFLKFPLVAIRSSATAEDLPGASFAGQQDTYLNIEGETNVLKKVHQSWASLFTPRAIFYRQEKKFDHLKVGIASVVQMMVASECSGVMFTTDPVTNEKNRITIEAILGLGELIVQGAVTPDHYEVDKHNLDILVKNISDQSVMLVKKGKDNVEVKLKKDQKRRQKITDSQIKGLSKLGKQLEKHYFFPQDIEWAIKDNNLYIVQTRPITTFKDDKSSEAKSSEKKTPLNLKLILKGDPASPGIKSGPVNIIYQASEIDKVMAGDVLVTVQTNPDFVPAMKKAVAIVTERGGRTSHAAIVSRELGIPAVVGAPTATKKLTRGQIITVDGGKGEIYEGKIEEQLTTLVEKTRVVSKVPLKTVTRVYVNLATPNRITEVSQMNTDGIGLLRAEFMIADIGIHPKKLLKEGKQKFFIEKLSQDLLKFCQAFNPRPVVYRATDFKTNEYRNLIGGKDYEPEEPNPMLGYRGAYRYMSDPQVFNMELETIKLVRDQYGFKNLWLMLPFVRTVNELVEVKKIIAKSNLSRSPTFKLWMMVEIPSNVILLDQFCQVGIDGVSIGSNDLTMLILGTDRDNTEVSPEFDERNDAVMWAIERVIKICHQYKVTSSICGQAPSDYPELVEKLVSWGITSMS
ncbi:phosphoenolpyruvate synthase, partial [Candidatus Gottesmanbacteria bacterium RIFCSPLOWO2_02_FULL_38_8]